MEIKGFDYQPGDLVTFRNSPDRQLMLIVVNEHEIQGYYIKTCQPCKWSPLNFGHVVEIFPTSVIRDGVEVYRNNVEPILIQDETT